MIFLQIVFTQYCNLRYQKKDEKEKTYFPNFPFINIIFSVIIICFNLNSKTYKKDLLICKVVLHFDFTTYFCLHLL